MVVLSYYKDIMIKKCNTYHTTTTEYDEETLDGASSTDDPCKPNEEDDAEDVLNAG